MLRSNPRQGVKAMIVACCNHVSPVEFLNLVTKNCPYGLLLMHLSPTAQVRRGRWGGWVEVKGRGREEGGGENVDLKYSNLAYNFAFYSPPPLSDYGVGEIIFSSQKEAQFIDGKNILNFSKTEISHGTPFFSVYI